MRILLINPNTSADMTARAAAEAHRCASPGTQIDAATAEFGCAVIASRASYAIAAHATLDTYARRGAGADGMIVACFGDPGVDALREIAPVPVVGLAEAAVNDAAELAVPFAIVTAGRAWIPMLTDLVRLTPHLPLFRGVFALDTTGLQIGREPDRFASLVIGALDSAAAAGASTVILGGAAFAGTATRFAHRVTLIDPVQSAVGAVEKLVLAGNPGSGSPRALERDWRGLSPALTHLLTARGAA